MEKSHLKGCQSNTGPCKIFRPVPRRFWSLILLGWLAVFTSRLTAAEVKLPTLKVGEEVYTDVTVTSATVTDIYFSHSRGIGNAKLKNLDAELQKKFHFDPAKAEEKEQQQAQAHG